MSVTFNPNSTFDPALAGIGKSLETAALEGAAAAESVPDEGVVVSDTEAGGTNPTLAFLAPELGVDGETAPLTDGQIAELHHKLDGLSGEIGGALNETLEVGREVEATGVVPTTGRKALLFSIYTLMRLMLEVAQSQKEAARDLRNAELERACADVRNRADQMKDAAVTGLVLTITLTAASIGAQAAATYASAKAQSAANGMESTMGVTEAQENLSLLSAQDAKEAELNYGNIQKKYAGDAEVAGIVNDTYSGAQPQQAKVNAAQAKLETAARAQTEAQAKYDAAAGALNGDVENLDARVTAAEQEVKTAKEEVGKIENELKKEGVPEEQKTKLAGELDAANDKVKTAGENLSKLKDCKDASGKLDAAKKDAEAAKAEFKTAQDGYAAALDRCQNGLESKLGSKRLELVECERKIDGSQKIPVTDDQGKPVLDADGKPVERAPTAEELKELKSQAKELKSEISTLGKARHLGKAYVVKEKFDGGMNESINADMTNAETVRAQKTALLQSDAKYRAYMAQAKKYELIAGLSGQMGQMFTNVTMQATSFMQANAAAQEATQKTDESAREESNDLAASIQQLIKSVLDLLAAIQASENQTIQRIMA